MIRAVAIIFLFIYTLPAFPRNVFPDTTVFNLNKNKILTLTEIKLRQGDDSAWSKLNYDDSTWGKISLGEAKNQVTSLSWMRIPVLLEGSFEDPDLLAVNIYNLASAFEIYWDGAFVGRNGLPGKNAETETVGKVRRRFVLDRLNTEPGMHVLAVKISDYHALVNNKQTYIQLGYNSEVASVYRGRLDESVLYMGVYFTAALFCFAVFLGGWKNKAFLVFGIFIFPFFLRGLWFYLSETEIVSLSYFNLFETSFYFWVYFSGLVYLLFIFFFFEQKNKWSYIAVAAVIMSVLYYALRNINMEILSRVLDLGLSLYIFIYILLQMKKNIHGTFFLLAAESLLVGYTIYFMIDFDTVFEKYQLLLNLLVNILYVLLTVAAIGRLIQWHNKKYIEVLLKSQRLETELLKKTIQPHFMSNTLLSLKSLINTDARKAEKLIEALSDEFHLINEISEKKEIPIEKEIELCRLHLEVMGYRFGAVYELNINDNCEKRNLPPMIFHTLIENGITHAFESKENGVFNLKCVCENGMNTFRFTNNGSRLKKFKNENNPQIEEGLGFKYVKSRLEENYPGKWKLNYGMNDGLWEVKIEYKS